MTLPAGGWHLQGSSASIQVLDPLVAKAAALDACNALCAWVKPRQAHLFLPL